MVLHLILSWKWITAKTRQIFKRQATPALIAIGALAFGVLFLFWVGTPKDAAAFRSYGQGAEHTQKIRLTPLHEAPPLPEQSGREEELPTEDKPAAPAFEPERYREEDHQVEVGSITITGQQTIRDLEKATGISALTIARGLGLPEAVPLNETLGRLRRLYGFEIQDVRDLVARIIKERESSRD